MKQAGPAACVAKSMSPIGRAPTSGSFGHDMLVCGREMD
jgi:hypothetical protein